MPHPADVDAGRLIRQLRRLKGMTQTQLAEKIEVKFQQLQKYETAGNRVSVSRLSMIADALSVHPAIFFSPFNQEGSVFEALSKNEIELIRAHRKLPKGLQHALTNLAKEFSAK